jgi:hypothetical protein
LRLLHSLASSSTIPWIIPTLDATRLLRKLQRQNHYIREEILAGPDDRIEISIIASQ